MKYIDSDKLIAEINNRLMSVNLEELGNFGCHRVWAYNDVKDLIISLQQEQPLTIEKVVEQCKKFGGNPEIIQQEQPEVDLEKYKKYDEALAIAKAWYKSSASSAQERNVARMIMGDIVMD